MIVSVPNYAEYFKSYGKLTFNKFSLQICLIFAGSVTYIDYTGEIPQLPIR